MSEFVFSPGLPKSFAARVTTSGSPSISTATWTPIPFASEDYDPDNMHDVSTNNTRVTAPASGKYVVAGAAIFQNSSAGTRYLAYAVNGTRRAQEPLAPAPSPTTNQAVALPDILLLAADDYVELHCYQDSGGTLTLAGGAYFSVGFIGT